MFLVYDDIKQAFSESRLAELTSDEGDSVDMQRINRAMSFVNTLIADFLRSQYSLPLDPIPASIKDIAISLVSYKILEIRFREKMPQDAKLSWDNAISLLKQYQRGDLVLDIASPPDTNIMTASSIYVKSKPSVFNIREIDY